ncbi:unnamed protein product [Heterobilharzia americana]|nr:unnamed protein product [Heterobilharzia americana]
MQQTFLSPFRGRLARISRYQSIPQQQRPLRTSANQGAQSLSYRRLGCSSNRIREAHRIHKRESSSRQSSKPFLSDLRKIPNSYSGSGRTHPSSSSICLMRTHQPQRDIFQHFTPIVLWEKIFEDFNVPFLQIAGIMLISSHPVGLMIPVDTQERFSNQSMQRKTLSNQCMMMDVVKVIPYFAQNHSKFLSNFFWDISNKSFYHQLLFTIYIIMACINNHCYHPRT